MPSTSPQKIPSGLGVLSTDEAREQRSSLLREWRRSIADSPHVLDAKNVNATEIRTGIEAESCSSRSKPEVLMASGTNNSHSNALVKLPDVKTVSKRDFEMCACNRETVRLLPCLKAAQVDSTKPRRDSTVPWACRRLARRQYHLSPPARRPRAQPTMATAPPPPPTRTLRPTPSTARPSPRTRRCWWWSTASAASATGGSP